MQKTASKWAVRVIGTTLAASTALTICALPASAEGDRVTSWGATPQEAFNNAQKFCREIVGGTLTQERVDFHEQQDGRWMVTIGCSY